MPVGVVTGASRGLGAALAAELRARGFDLALCATTLPDVEDALCRRVDVADGEAVEAFAAEAARELGPLEVWINNAAILGPVGPFAANDPDDWRRCIEVNVHGVVNGTRALLAHRHQASATLLNIASRVAPDPAPGLSAYSASKAAVVAFTVSVAEELRDSGLRAIAVLPPSVDTDMQDTLLNQDESAFPHVGRSRQRQREGGVLPPDVAARAVLDAVFDAAAGPVVDLTALRTG